MKSVRREATVCGAPRRCGATAANKNTRQSSRSPVTKWATVFPVLEVVVSRRHLRRRPQPLTGHHSSVLRRRPVAMVVDPASSRDRRPASDSATRSTVECLFGLRGTPSSLVQISARLTLQRVAEEGDRPRRFRTVAARVPIRFFRRLFLLQFSVTSDRRIPKAAVQGLRLVSPCTGLTAVRWRPTVLVQPSHSCP